MYSTLVNLILIQCSLIVILPVHSWDGHDITTLKLLQVVHRHGDRNPENWFPGDPYNINTGDNMANLWPEGDGELTLKGKYRMYKVGRYLRDNYDEYLGQAYSPREVYARSSAQSRCLESVSTILSGAYPPVAHNWTWDMSDPDAQLGQSWQPFPIYTYPRERKDDDSLLRSESYCPKADQAVEEHLKSQESQAIMDREKAFLADMAEPLGQQITDLKMVNDFWDTLSIEYDRGYKWSAADKWPPEDDLTNIARLRALTVDFWNTRYKSPVFQRLRAGPLLQELTDNMRFRVNGTPRTIYKHRLFLYSTHDSKVGVLMNALDLWNDILMPFGSALLVELHQKPVVYRYDMRADNTKGYFVRVYYFNETDTLVKSGEVKTPILLKLPKCEGLYDCPLDKWYAMAEGIVPKDFDGECKISGTPSSEFNYNYKGHVKGLQIININL